MANRESIKQLIKSISGQASTITIPKLFLGLLDGDYPSAVLLNQCVYWTDVVQSKGTNRDGWFYKSARDWQDEICLTYSQITRASKKLNKLGLLEVKKQRAHGAPTMHYRAHMDNLTNMILEFSDFQESRKSGKSKMDFQQSLKSDFQQSSKSLTIDYTEDYQEDYTDDHHQPTKGLGVGGSQEFLNFLNQLGIKKSGIEKILNSGWTEQEIRNEIDLIAEDKSVKSIPGTLIHRVVNDSPSPIVKKSDDSSKYTSGEFGQFVKF